jgi:hypothetical protein
LLGIHQEGLGVVRVDDTLVGVPGLVILLFQRQVSRQRQPIPRRSVIRRSDEDRIAIYLVTAGLMGPPPDPVAHFDADGLDYFVLMDRGRNTIGFEVRIEGFHMIFYRVRPLSVHVMRASTHDDDQDDPDESHGETVMLRDMAGSGHLPTLYAIRPAVRSDTAHGLCLNAGSFGMGVDSWLE